MLTHLVRHGRLAIFLGSFVLLCLGCTGKTSSTEDAKAKNPNAQAPPHNGTLDVADKDIIGGWAWDPNRPDSAIKVEIYDGQTLLGTITADQFRQDLLDAGIGNGKHCFIMPTPASLKDGRSHTIRAFIAGTKTELEKSPQTITLRGP